MQKIIPSLLILFCSIAQAQNNLPIIIDGKTNDWHQPISHYDAQTKLCYEIKNDNNNFYFCFKATDEKTQMRIMRMGFQISVDIKGKKNTDNYLTYKPETEMSGGKKPGAPPSIQTEKSRFKAKPLLFFLSGFKSYSKGIYEANLLKNIQFAIDWDTANSLIIEYKIPFSELSYIPDTTKDVSVGVFLLAMEMLSGMPSGGMGEPPSGGMGSPPSGGTPPSGEMGGPPNGSIRDFDELSQQLKFWTKFKVSISK